jgi:hypothetical protein
MDEHTRHAEWWIPGKRQRSVAGTLTFSEEGNVRLKLFDDLPADSDPLNFGSTTATDRILGKSVSGTSLTLTDIIPISPTKYEYQVGFLYEGHHLESSDPELDRVRIEIPFAEEWAGLANPHQTMLSDANGSDLIDSIEDAESTQRIYVEDPQRSSMSAPFGILVNEMRSASAAVGSVDILAQVYVNMHTEVFHSGNINLRTVFDIEPTDGGLAFSEYENYVRRLRDLLAFVLNRPIQPRSLVGRIQPNSKERDPVNVDIYHSNLDKAVSRSPQMLFCAYELDHSLDQIIERWFDTAERHGAVLDLYSSTQYNTQTHVESTFLLLMQAVEAYHRTSHQDRYLDADTFDAVQTALKAFVDGDISVVYSSDQQEERSGSGGIETLHDMYNLENDFRNKVHSTIDHINEYSLRKRLRELVTEHESAIQSLRHNIAEEHLQHSIIETRNHLTHQDPNPSDPDAIAGHDKLLELTWGVQQLIEVCLLDELDLLGNEAVEQGLKTRYRHRQAL